MSNSTISGNKKERIMDFDRLSEIYDKMDPTECIDYMHETTCFDDETGEYRLDIPEWPSLEPEWPWHENEPRQVITYTMKNWSEEDCENIKEDYLKLIDLIRKSVKTFSIEEGIISGGFGESLERELQILGFEKDVTVFGVRNPIVRAMSQKEQLKYCGLDGITVASSIKSALQR